MKLYVHQANAVKKMQEQSLALFHDCGTGKTLTSLMVCKHHVTRGRGPCLVVAPLSILEAAWVSDAKKFTPYLSIINIWDKKPKERRRKLREKADIYVCNYETLKSEYARICEKRFAVMIVDECFVGDTLIDTEQGTQRIKDIKPGDKVWNCLGLCQVKNARKRYLEGSLVLTTIRGIAIISSANHPYFTRRGWVKAKDLTERDYVVYTSDAMRMVQNGSCARPSKNEAAGIKKEAHCEGVLREVLFSEMEDEAAMGQDLVHRTNTQKNKQSLEGILSVKEPCCEEEHREDCELAPHDKPGEQGQSIKEIARDRTRTKGQRRQWQGANSCSTDVIPAFERDIPIGGLGDGVCTTSRETKEEGISDALQDRSSVKGDDVSYRGGRVQSHGDSTKRTGRKEGCETQAARVESVTVYKSSNTIFDRYRDEAGRIVLYDLEVEGHPSFSVNGFLVHNSSKLKSRTSQITQCVLSFTGMKYRGSKFKLAEKVDYRYCLSGTPAPNNVNEYWAQVKFVTGLGNRGVSDSYYAFRSRFFTMIRVSEMSKAQVSYFTPSEDEFLQMCDWMQERELPNWQASYINGLRIGQGWRGMSDKERLRFITLHRNLGGTRFLDINPHYQAFLEEIKPFCDVVRKRDVLDLPDQVHCLRMVTLSPGESQAYKKFKRSLVLELGDSVVMAETVLTKIMKLRQMTSGFVYDEEGRPLTVGSSKLSELDHLLWELGDNQAIIWCNFTYEIDTIKAMLEKKGHKVSTLYGKTEDREVSRTDFIDGTARYLIANPRSAAHGYTFVNCKYAIYYSPTDSYEMIKQSQDRIDRLGQTSQCTYYHLLAKDTWDEVVYRNSGNKAMILREALAFLRS